MICLAKLLLHSIFPLREIAIPYAAHAEGDKAGDIRLEGERYDIVDSAERIACHGGGNGSWLLVHDCWWGSE